MECLKSLTGESPSATDAFAVFGNAVTDLQTDYCVVLALPKTQMTMSDQSTAVVSKQVLPIQFSSHWCQSTHRDTSQSKTHCSLELRLFQWKHRSAQ